MKVTAEDWNKVWSSKSIGHRLLDKARVVFTKDLYRTLFKTKINKKTKLLEVGCGSSTTSTYLCQYIKSFTGLDISEEALKVSRRNAKAQGIKNAYFVKGDCFDMPFKSNTFDVVWSQGLLEHFDNPKKILQEKIRVTKKGGYTITSVPALWSYHKVWYVGTRPKMLRRFWLWTDQTFYTRKMLDTLAQGEPVIIEKTYHYPKYGNIIQILKKK